jgi:hypothetical protein
MPIKYPMTRRTRRSVTRSRCSFILSAPTASRSSSVGRLLPTTFPGPLVSKVLPLDGVTLATAPTGGNPCHDFSFARSALRC